MIGTSSVLVSKNSRLNILLGGLLLIQASASPAIFAVSKILNLVDLEPTPTRRPRDWTDGSLESTENRLLQTQRSEGERGFDIKVS